MSFDDGYKAWKEKKKKESNEGKAISFDENYTRWKWNNHGDKIIDTLNSRVSSWAEKSDSLYKDYQSRYAGRKGTYEDAYVSDSQDWLTSLTLRRTALDADKEAINSLLGQYGGYLDKDWVSGVTTLLDSSDQAYGEIFKVAESDAQYWNQWESREAYDAWAKGEKDYYDNWGRLTEAEDYAQYSAPAGAKRMESQSFLGFYTGDDKYDFINNIDGYRDVVKLMVAMNGSDSGKGEYGDYGIYTYMDEKQVGIYNYVYATQGREAADDYLAAIGDKLGMQQGEDIYKDMPGFRKALYWLPGGLEQAKSGIAQLFSEDKVPLSPISAASSMVQQEADAKSPVLGTMYSAGTTIANMTPSILVSIATGNPYAGAAVMGASASGNAYGQALAEGYSKAQAAGYGVLVGASEALLQSALGGIGKLAGAGNVSSKLLGKIATIDNAFLRIAAKYGVSIAGEIAEEELQNFLEPAFRTILFGEDYDAPTIEELLETAIVTAISTGVLEGSDIISGEVDAHSYRKTHGEFAQELVNEALEIDPGNAYAKKVQSYIEGGKTATGNQLKNLVQQNEAGMVKNDRTAIHSATEQRLTELGETGDIKAIADALAKQTVGEKLGVAERRAIKDSKYGQRVANELNTKNIQSGQYATEWAQGIGTDRINAEEYGSLIRQLEAEGYNQAATAHQPQVDSKLGAIKTKTTAPDTATEKSSVTGQEGVQVESTVSIEEVAKKYGNQADAVVRAYNLEEGKQDVAEFDTAYKAAHDMGRAGVSMDYAMNSEQTKGLTRTQIEWAYNAGRDAANEAAASLSAANAAKANGTTGWKKGVVKGENVTIAALKKTFNDTQNTAYKVLSTFAEATGIDIVLYKSEADADGKLQGAQGRFSRSEPGTIYIDINAGILNIKSVGDLAKYTMLRTFAHEFTHFIENWNPEAYNEFKKVVFDTLTQRGENVHDLIEAKQAKNPGMGYDKASREVVAEAMTDILPDSNFVQTLAEKHKNIFTKLLAKLKEFVKNLRDYFNSIGSNRSREANALKEQVGDAIRYVDSIVKLFDQVAVQAVENYQKTVATVEVAQEVNENAGREETRKSFYRRSHEAVRTVRERGAIATAYNPASNKTERAGQTERELQKLGIQVIVHEGLEANKDGITRVIHGDSSALAGDVVYVRNSMETDPVETAGHEAYHFWKHEDTRSAYTDTVVDNIEFSSDAFIEFQKKISDAYFNDEIGIEDDGVDKLAEEIFAYITGLVHAGDNGNVVRPFLRDYDTVKAAWEELVKKQTAEAASKVAVSKKETTTTETKVSDAYTAPKTVEITEKLDDFGEKIGGARKDLWSSRGLDVSDLDEMNDRERDKNVKKDKVWKRPDYKKLVEGGSDRGLLYAVNEIRKSLQQNISYRRGTTPEAKLETQRVFVETIRQIQKMAMEAQTAEAFKKMGYQWAIENGYLEETNSISYKYQFTHKWYKNPALQGSNYIQTIEYIAKNFSRLNQLAEKAGFATDTSSQVPKGYSIIGGPDSAGSKLVNGEWVKDESWSIAKGKFIIKSGFATYEEALEVLKNAAASKKKKTRFIPKQLQEVHRKGPDYRAGRNVDGQRYLNDFGFKGGEFGNWMSEKDRRVSLNYGYDALKDLAAAIRIADGDISLSGNLSIAFGARGQGLSGASAHYERERHVINLTKMNGAGSLAHEWFHALDDYAGGYTESMATENMRKLPEKTKEAFRNLVSAMQYRESTDAETDLAATKRYEQAKKNVEYHLKDLFGFIYKFEEGKFTEANAKYYNRIPTQEDVDKFHSIVDGIMQTGDPKYIEELSALRKDVAGHVIPKEDREAFGYRLMNLTPEAQRNVQKFNVRTDFYNNSRRFGEIHAKDGDYWDSTVEMAARAFACYITDKTNSQNDYLSAHSDSAVALDADKDGNITAIKAFPEGQERERINAAFDHLIEALKADGLLHERGDVKIPDTVQYQRREYLEENNELIYQGTSRELLQEEASSVAGEQGARDNRSISTKAEGTGRSWESIGAEKRNQIADLMDAYSSINEEADMLLNLPGKTRNEALQDMAQQFYEAMQGNRVLLENDWRFRWLGQEISLFTGDVERILDGTFTADEEWEQEQIRDYLDKERKYSYEWFAAKPDMAITTVDDTGTYHSGEDRKRIIVNAIANAKAAGTVNSFGNAVVHVFDNGADVIVSKNGIKHSLDRRAKVVGPVAERVGDILKNAIQINELNPRDEKIKDSYILMSAAKNKKNEPYIVSFVVNRYSNELVDMDVMYSVNAKTEPAGSLSPSITAQSTDYFTGSAITIANYLNLVNKYFPDVLPEDVLKHYGYDRRPDGVLGQDTLYQERSEALTDREVLQMAASEVKLGELNEAEKDALRIFQERLSKLEALQTERAEQGRLYKEQQFGAKVDREAAEKTLNRMHTLDAQIQKASADVLTVEEKTVLKRVLQKARKVVEKQQWAHDQEVLSRWRDRRKNSDAIKKYRARLTKDVSDLTNWVLHPNNKDVVKHIPDVLKTSVIPFLSSIDFTSKQQLRGGAATQADKEFMKRLNGLKAALKPNQSIDGLYGDYSDLPPNFMDRLQMLIDFAQAIVEKNSGEFVVNQMTADELRELSQVVRTLKEYIQNFNKFHANAMFQHVHEAGDSTIEELGGMKNAGDKTGTVSNFVFWQQIRPAYAWERFGEGGKAIYDGLRRGQAKLAFNTKEIQAFAEKAYTEAEVKAWEKEIKEIPLGGDIVKMPVSTIMSFYELSKRPQALGHILGAGVRVATYKAGGKKISDTGHIITPGDVQTIIGTLTDRQKEVADNLQKFMQEQGGKWGNFVSVKRFGEELFGEDHYFPINSDGRHLAANADEHPSAASLYALLNMGFTKATTEGANNRIVLYSIFDVFANHMASMAQYNAFALPVVDAIKWFNYQQKSDPDEDGKRLVLSSVRDQMDRVYGVPEETRPGSGRQGYAQGFVINILKAFNGTEAQGVPTDTTGLTALRQYNMAQVAFNFRSVIQQPLAITRAALLVDYGSIIKGMKLKPAAIRQNIQEMQRYSGIAAWKGLGFYDVNISRGLTDIIKHSSTVRDKISEVGMWGAEKADLLTWAGIWSACKEEVIKKQRLTPKSEGFFEAVTELFEDVVYKTQVVDSVLTKNEYLRSKGFFARFTGSFMSEPTTTASMLIDAYDKFGADMQRGMSRQQAWKKNGKMIVRTAYVYGLGAVLLAAVQAVADAFRDDDGYETWLEKWLEAFGGNLVDELMPLNKLPILSDFYEGAKEMLSIFGVDTYGNTSQSAWMQWYDSLFNGVKILNDKIQGEDTNYTWYGGAYRLLQAVSGMTGLPMAAGTREIVTAWNNIVGAMAPSLKVKTYEPGEKNEIKYAYQDGYLTEAEAAQQLLEQGLAETEDEAYWIIQEWDNGTDYSRYDDVYEAVRTGGDFSAAMKELTDHGYTEKEVISQVTSQIGKWYYDPDTEGERISRTQAEAMLDRYTDLKPDEITAKVNKWSCKVVTGISYNDIKSEMLSGNITKQRAIEMLCRYGGYTKSEAAKKVKAWEKEDAED